MRVTESHPRRSVAMLLILGIATLPGCAASQPVAQAPKAYSFWPAAPDNPHVQFLVSFNTSHDVATSRSKFDEMLYGRASGLGLIKPYGVAVWNGRIYVTDLRVRGVVVFDLKQQQTRLMGVSGSADVQKAIAISIGPDGTKYVIDSAKNVIVVFDADERHIQTIALPDFNPVDLAVYQNELYVSDFEGQKVKVLDARTGSLLRTIGGPGPNDGQFVRPLSIRIDNNGNVIVADVFKCRIQKFTRDGKFISAFGRIGTRPGEFVRPKHMAVDSSGMLYIVDASFSNVQVFDPAGKVVGFFGSMGTHAGAMDLPAGLCIAETDLDLFQPYVHPAFEARRIIIVSNQFGPNKVAVYAEGGLKPGKTVADVQVGRATVGEGLTDANAGPTTGPITIGRPLPTELAPTSMPVAPGDE